MFFRSLTQPSRLTYNFLGLPLVAFSQSLILFRLLGHALAQTLGDWWGTFLWNSGYNPVVLWSFLIPTLALLFLLTYGRARRVGWNKPWLFVFLSALPFVGIGSGLWLGVSNDREATDAQVDTYSLAGKLIAPIAGCWLVLLLLSSLGDHVFKLQGFLSITTFILLPFVTAGIAAHLAAEAGLKYGQSIGAAITTLTAVLCILGLALMEGLVCIIMAMPFGLIIGFGGATLGYWIAKKLRTPSRHVQAVGWLSIVLCAFTEEISPPEPYLGEVSTSILIQAPPEKVWAELHNIHHLPPTNNLLFQLGVAYPLETITEGQGGIGAHRLCRLSTGDMPEIINVWRPNEALRFDVLETPATMKEAAFFGQSIDTAHLHNTYKGLEGGFLLIPQPNHQTLLIGDSRYLLSLAPSPYWNLWTTYIVHSVHQRVLEHIKVQAEKANSPAR